MRLPWAREGLVFIALCLAGGLAGLALIAAAAKLPVLKAAGWVMLAAGFGFSLLGLVFFRDPERSSNALPGQILSPADGRIMAVEEVREASYFNGPARRIAIFMHLANVHVQRLPSGGRLVWSRWQPGKFLPAFRPDAARSNEQRWYAFAEGGRKFAVVQIAGLLARRTISWLQDGQTCARGQRLGMIAFGSEVDVYLPLEVKVTVAKNQRVRAGRTVIGQWAP